MEKVKLSHVVKYRKQFIEISDQKTYKRCRVQLHRRGVKLRDVVSGEAIKTKKQRVCKENDFIVAEMDAKFGGYGIVPKELDGAVVSSHYYLYELEKSKIFPAYLNILIDSGIFQEQIKAVGSTNYSRVSAKEVLEYEIHCPDLDTQIKIIDFYSKSKEKCCGLHSEATHQQNLLKKLRQSIFQEAIEGKLTADWRKQNPDVEPASELLKRIQTEKEQLIKDKKIKKQKPLPPISEKEKPFELPDGWEWCQFGGLIYNLQYGTSKKCSYDTTRNTPILRIPNISSGHLDSQDLKYTDLTYKEKDQYSLKACDLLVIRSNGSRELVGKSVFVPKEFERFGYAGYLIRLRFALDKLNIFYIQKYLGSMTLREQIERPLRTTVGINNINSTELSNLLIPLPPLPEQKAIVTKAEKLLALCGQMEQQITIAQTHSEGLMQAVLKEAFQRGGTS